MSEKHEEVHPTLTAAELIGRMVDHVNAEIKALNAEKEALKALHDSGLVSRQGDVIEVDGQKMPFDRRFGQLEGREEGINSLSAFVIAVADESLGRLHPSQIPET